MAYSTWYIKIRMLQSIEVQSPESADGCRQDDTPNQVEIAAVFEFRL